MDGSITDEQAHLWLNDLINNAYISLHYDSPALGGLSRSEISGGGYARARVPFSTPSSRTTWSLADAVFTGLVQNKLTHFGIWNAATGGRLVAYSSLGTPALIANGQGFILHEGDLAISIA